MWATEYQIHEHRKELLRTAAQIRLAREAQAQPRRGVVRRWALEFAGWLQRFRRQFPLVPLATPAMLKRRTT